MTQYLSQKIRILSFLSIILVLYIHSGFHDYPNEIQGMTFNFKLQEVISGMLGRCAVPLFYAISEYLFFLGLDDGKEKDDYGKLGIKIKKRFRTLFVPYIIACLFPAAFYFIMEQIFLLLCIVQMSYFSDCWKYLNIPIIILGMVSVWIVYDKICPNTFDIRNHKILMTVCSFTFFIYLFHEPTLNIVRKIIIIPFHHSSFGFAVSYLLNPWIFAFICIIVGMAFKKVLPRVYNICVGGR